MDAPRSAPRFEGLPHGPGGGAPMAFPVIVSGGASSCKQGLCFLGVLILVVLAVWLFWAPPRSAYPGSSLALAAGRSFREQFRGPAELYAHGVPQRAAPRDDGDARPLPVPEDGTHSAHSTGGGATWRGEEAPAHDLRHQGALPSSLAKTPQPTLVSGVMAGNALDANTFQVSEDTEAYYKVFKPVSLESTMPMGWRTAPEDAAKNRAAGEEDVYSEFNRYAIAPTQMKRAETMRSVLRLGELSRDGLSRTLGQRSLLRDFVTPLGPNPVGESAMLWNDSSVRQSYIAAATGRFPEVAER